MTPSGWIPVRRPGDDELVGYLTVDGRGATPLTLFGYALSGPVARADAGELLCRRGLAVLADPWWLQETDGPGFRVQIMSATPDEITVVRADYGLVDPHAPLRRLPVPVEGLRPYVG